eukprot:383682-Rhodomonas_salina.2
MILLSNRSELQSRACADIRWSELRLTEHNWTPTCLMRTAGMLVVSQLERVRGIRTSLALCNVTGVSA